MPLRTIDLLGAISLAADLAIGLPDEHTARSCYVAMRGAQELALPSLELANVYYGTLLMDAGCTAWTSQFADLVMSDEIAARRAHFIQVDSSKPLEILSWLARYVARDASLPTRARHMFEMAVHGRDFVREGVLNSTEVAKRFAQRLGMSEDVQRTLLHVFEWWDGNGLPDGLRGEQIPIAARVIHASTILESFHRLGGFELARRRVEEWRGSRFDPAVVSALLAASERQGFWEVLEQAPVWDTVRLMQPAASVPELSDEQEFAAATLIADFTDMKSPFSVGHSRRVAVLAERVAQHLALPERNVREVQLAALTHDIGRVAIPSFVLNKPRHKLAPAEWEVLRLHPYYTERILLRLPQHKRIAAIAAAHHERPDGQGYHRGLNHDQIPTGAAIIAAVDQFDDLIHVAPDHEALAPEAALRQMRADVGRAFDPEAFAALASELGASMPGAAVSRIARRWPSGLTDREVDILRLAAIGLTRRQIAGRLIVTEGTVRSHLEHIYGKIGVRNRAGATLFAMEHDLLD